MGEIDTKPIEPVQVALSFFGEKGYQKKQRSNSSELETENDIDVETLLKNLASHKLQLEAKDSSYIQVVLKVDQYRETVDELSTLLKISEAERDKGIDEYRDARTHIDELESKMKEMADQLADNEKLREQLVHASSELKNVQEELSSMETELAAAYDLQLKATKQSELIEAAANTEREKVNELLSHVLELNEAINVSKIAVINKEKETNSVMSEKEAQIDLSTAAAVEAWEQLENMRSSLELMHNLEYQILEKSAFIDILQLELEKVNKELSLSQKALTSALSDINGLYAELDIKERNSSNQASSMDALETEINVLKSELKNANEEVDRTQSNIDILKTELERKKYEMDEVKARENAAQVEIDLLKSELHKERTKIAAAEAAEARSQSVKSRLYLAVQQLAEEAKEAKKENQRLKQGEKVAELSEVLNLFNRGGENDHVISNEEPKEVAEELSDHNGVFVTISLDEYESLIRKADDADGVPDSPAESSNQLGIMADNKSEQENLKKELEAAMAKVGEFRTRAEQAVTRAESAEKAKLAVEDQLRKWREQKQKRKAALAALREESVPKQYDLPTYKLEPTKYQPLGKVLNLKF